MKGSGARNKINQCMCLGGSFDLSVKPGSKIDIRDNTLNTLCINPQISQMKSNASHEMSQLILFTFPATNNRHKYGLVLLAWPTTSNNQQI